MWLNTFIELKYFDQEDNNTDTYLSDDLTIGRCKGNIIWFISEDWLINVLFST